MLRPQTNRFRGRILLGAIFIFAILCTATRSEAVVLPVPGGVNLVGSSGIAKPDGSYTLVADTGAVPYASEKNTYSGTLISRVYTNDSDLTNPYGIGSLTFVYILSNSPTSLHDLHRLTISSFAGFQTDVNFSTSLPSGHLPTSADRNPLPGDVVGFNFPTSIPGLFVGNGPITHGETSAALVVQTDAVLWQPTLAAVINGSTTMVDSLAPLPIVPEPSTLALGGVAMAWALVAAYRRRRRSA